MDSPSKIRTSAKMCLRYSCDRAMSIRARVQKARSFLSCLQVASPFTREKQLISLVLKLLKRDLSSGVGLQPCIELIVRLHAGFAACGCRHTTAEFLKMHAYVVEGDAASAVGTFNSHRCWA